MTETKAEMKKAHEIILWFAVITEIANDAEDMVAEFRQISRELRTAEQLLFIILRPGKIL